MGRVWKFGNDIDTDVITPGRFNLSTDPAHLAKYCFCEIAPTFNSQVKNGDFIVAGKNFGCGSSRESAALAIKTCGIKAVIAVSFARIFYRNAVNLGLPLIVLNEKEINEINQDEELDVDINQQERIVKNLSTGKQYPAQPTPEFVLNIVRAGGILNLLNQGGSFE